MKSRFLTVRDDCLTEERSKAEIKNSALRRSDETQSCYPHHYKKELLLLFRFLGFFHHFGMNFCPIKIFSTT